MRGICQGLVPKKWFAALDGASDCGGEDGSEMGDLLGVLASAWSWGQKGLSPLHTQAAFRWCSDANGEENRSLLTEKGPQECSGLYCGKVSCTWLPAGGRASWFKLFGGQHGDTYQKPGNGPCFDTAILKGQNKCAQKFGSKNSHLDNICNEEKLKIISLPISSGLVRKTEYLPAIKDLRMWRWVY